MKNLIYFFACFFPLIVASQTSGIRLLNAEPEISIVTDTIKIFHNGSSKSVFKTPEIIRYNYNVQVINALSDQITHLTNSLYDNSIQTDPSLIFPKDSVDSKLLKLKSLKKKKALLNRTQDSLYFIYTKDYLQYDKLNVLNFNSERSAAFFDLIYGNKGKRFNVLNHTGFTFGNKSASIYSELVSGNLGIVRVSFGSLISNSSSEDTAAAREDEAFQRLASNGGNTVLTLEYPIAYLHSKNNQYNLISRFIAKGTADFPEFGTLTDEFAGSGSIGLDLYADASLSNNSMRFFMNMNMNAFISSDSFQQNLGIDNSSFSFGQLTLGLVVAKNIKLSFIVKTFSSQSSLNNKNLVVGGQILH